MYFEIDASPSSEGAPASVVATGGVLHNFKSGFGISALAIVGLTAWDPAVGVSISLSAQRHGFCPRAEGRTGNRLRQARAALIIYRRRNSARRGEPELSAFAQFAKVFRHGVGVSGRHAVRAAAAHLTGIEFRRGAA